MYFCPGLFAQNFFAQFEITGYITGSIMNSFKMIIVQESSVGRSDHDRPAADHSNENKNDSDNLHRGKN